MIRDDWARQANCDHPLIFRSMPTYRIQPAIDPGELIPVRVPTVGERQFRLNLICSDPSIGSRGMLALADMLGMDRGLQHV